MFGYYLALAFRSLARNRVLTALMVLAIAFGVGASMTTLTVLRTLSADPLPGRSQHLYYPQLDPRPASGYMPGVEPPEQLTRTDAEALMRAPGPTRKALMSGGSAAIQPERADLAPFFVEARWTSSDFFAMFGAPFIDGTAWTRSDDDAAARVAVISRSLAEKVFGSTQVVGRSLRVEGTEFRVSGVLDSWRVSPHFYDLNTTIYGDTEQLFVPFSTSRELSLSRSGTTDCWENAPDPSALGAPCTWAQLWVELPSPDAVAAFEAYLGSYSQEQRRANRFTREPNVRLRNVPQWLAFKQVVPADVKLQTWIALGFLLVCLLNTVGLLLTKFLRRSSEIGVRRALGASKRDIFTQLLMEAAVVGLVGGAVGLALTGAGLWVIRSQPTEYAKLANLDLVMLALSIVLAIAATVLAGMFPAWRGCQVSPSSQLKAQ